MGCLKLTYRTDRAALKAAQGCLPKNGGTCAGAYRYGFNTQEKEDEISGSAGTHYSAEFWMYDTRTGRRWNLDWMYDTRTARRWNLDPVYEQGRKEIEYNTQQLEFGENAEEAEKIYRMLSVYSNLEFAYARYNDRFVSRNKPKISGSQNDVYTSFEPFAERLSTIHARIRFYQLIKHSHFHPEEKGYLIMGDRHSPSGPDFDFRDALIKDQNKSRPARPQHKIPHAKFYIFDGSTDIEYTKTKKP
jgi:hypothetical protein